MLLFNNKVQKFALSIITHKTLSEHFSFAFMMKNSRFLWLSFLLFFSSFCIGQSNGATAVKADVGVILDLDTTLGKVIKTCIDMAIEDFYSKHENYSTVIVPHFRNSRSDIVDAASAGNAILDYTTFILSFIIKSHKLSNRPLLQPLIC